MSRTTRRPRPQGIGRVLLVGTAVLLVAVGCAAPDPEGRARAEKAQSDVITIGVLRPSTGANASPGTDMENGWRLFWDQHGTEIAGNRVEMEIQDTAGNPAIGLNKARQLITNAQADIIVGPMLANVGLAVADYVDRKELPMVVPVASSDDLTQRDRRDYVVRLGGWSSSQTNHPLGEYAYEQGHRKAVTICTDYAFGYESCGGFTNTFTDKGGEVVAQLWNPLPTQDFSSYMAQIRQADPDVVFTEQVGVDSVRFVKAWNDFGMSGRGLQLLANETLVDQAALRSSGDGALGIVSSGHFAEGRDTADTREFVQAYHQRYGEYPSYYSAAMYTAGQGVAKAIEQRNGDVTEPRRVAETLRGIALEHTPFGPHRLDPFGNPILNVYIREVRPGPYGPWNVPTKTYENVSQFWEYDQDEFLRHPVYSKDYQGNGPWPRPR